jgi:hypothetical protein
VFTSVAPLVTITQALWFIGIGATGFGLLYAARVKSRLIAVVPLVLAAVVAVPTLSTVDDPVVPDPGAQALVCDEDGPKVCVTRAHADLLPALTGPAREALAMLKKLPTAPTSVVETGNTSADQPEPDAVLVYVDSQPVPDADTLRWIVLVSSTESGCRYDVTDDDTVVKVVAAQIIVTSWLTGASTPTTAPGEEYQLEYAHAEVKEGWRILKALPPDEQPARVAEIRQAALHCRGAALGTR